MGGGGPAGGGGVVGEGGACTAADAFTLIEGSRGTTSFASSGCLRETAWRPPPHLELLPHGELVHERLLLLLETASHLGHLLGSGRRRRGHARGDVPRSIIGGVRGGEPARGDRGGPSASSRTFRFRDDGEPFGDARRRRSSPRGGTSRLQSTTWY